MASGMDIVFFVAWINKKIFGVKRRVSRRSLPQYLYEINIIYMIHEKLGLVLPRSPDEFVSLRQVL